MIKTVNQYKVTMVRDHTIKYEYKTISSQQEVESILRVMGIDTDPQENIVVLYLNTRHKVIGVSVLGVGTCNDAVLDIPALFRGALLACAQSIIFAHNHPSGDCRPSMQDIETTKKIAKIGEMLGIQLLDSVIISDSDFISMKAENIF